MKIEDIEGIGPAFAQKLTAAASRRPTRSSTGAPRRPGGRAASEATGSREEQLLSGSTTPT